MFDQCFYCGIALDVSNRTVDHIIPISCGGTDTDSNKVPSCRKCNSSKGFECAISKTKPEGKCLSHQEARDLIDLFAFTQLPDSFDIRNTSGSACKVYLYLLMLLPNRNDAVAVSYTELSEQTGLSKTSVRNALAELFGKGYLAVYVAGEGRYFRVLSA